MGGEERYIYIYNIIESIIEQEKKNKMKIRAELLLPNDNLFNQECLAYSVEGERDREKDKERERLRAYLLELSANLV